MNTFKKNYAIFLQFFYPQAFFFLHLKKIKCRFSGELKESDSAGSFHSAQEDSPSGKVTFNCSSASENSNYKTN